jgi:hypothetical protein
MKKNFLLALGCALVSAFTINQSAKAQAAEFADPKYMAIGKASLDAMHSGDMGKWMSMFADNARYYWNAGDSLIGKVAISDYWTKRRSAVIQSIGYLNDIWLAVKVNQPQQAVQAPGVWLLGWYIINATYKTGKSMTQWTHVDIHFDANDKVDQVIQYIDRVPINTALQK